MLGLQNVGRFYVLADEKIGFLREMEVKTISNLWSNKMLETFFFLHFFVFDYCIVTQSKANFLVLLVIHI